MADDYTIKITITAADKATKQLKQTAKATDEVGKSASKFSSVMKGVKTGLNVFTKAIAGVGVVIGTMKQAFDFAKEGAELMRLEEAGDFLAESYGENMDDIVASIKDMTNNTIAESDAIRAANRAIMLGIKGDADEMGRLAEIAAFRARAMGMSTTEAFNDIVTGIGRASPLILDNLGIVIDSERVYGQYAKSIGKAASELTEVEQKQALFNAVLTEGGQQVDDAGGLTDDYGSELERLDVTITELVDTIKKGLVPGMADAAEGLRVLLTWNKTINEALEQQSGQVIDTAGSWEEYVDGIIAANLAAKRINEEQAVLVKETLMAEEGSFESRREWYRALINEMGIMEEAQFRQTRAVRRATQELEAQADIVANYPSDLYAATQAVEKFGMAQEEIDAKIKSLNEYIAGPVGNENKKYAEAHEELTQKIAETEEELAKYEARHGTVIGSTEQLVIAEYEHAQAVGKLEAAQIALSENTDPEKQLELEAAVARASQGVDGAAQSMAAAGPHAANYGVKISELRGELGTLEGQLTTLEQEHTRAMNQIIFNMLQARLATDGWTEAEMNLAIHTARSMDLIDESTARAAQQMNSELQAFAEGQPLGQTILGIQRIATEAGMTQEGFGTLAGVGEDTATRIAGAYDGISLIPTQEEIERVEYAMDDTMTAAQRSVESIQSDMDSVNTDGAVKELDDVKAAAEEIPEEVVVTVRIETEGSFPDIPGSHTSTPGYQMGTLNVPQTGMYMLHPGEAVLNAREAEAYRLGVQQATIQESTSTNTYNMNIYPQRADTSTILGGFQLMRSMAE